MLRAIDYPVDLGTGEFPAGPIEAEFFQIEQRIIGREGWARVGRHGGNDCDRPPGAGDGDALAALQQAGDFRGGRGHWVESD